MTVAKDQGLGAECASLQVTHIQYVIIIIIIVIIIVTITITIIIIVINIIRRQNMRLVLALPQTWWYLILL